MSAPQQLTLRRLFRARKGALVAAVGLVVAETVALQAGPLLVQLGVDRGVLAGNGTVVTAAGLGFGLAVLVGHVLSRVRIRQTGRLGQSLVHDLRLEVFGHLQQLSPAWYVSERSGRVLSRVTSDVDALSELLQDGVVNLLVQGLTLLLVTGVLLHFDPFLAVVLLLAVVPPVLLSTLWFRRRSSQQFLTVRQRLADVLADLSELLNGARVVTALAQEERVTREHRALVESYSDGVIATSRSQAVYGPGVDAIGLLAQGLVLTVGGARVLSGEMTVGELAGFLLYLSAFFGPVQQLVQLHGAYQSGRAAIRTLSGLLGTAPTVVEAPGAPALPADSGALHLRGVSFSYLPGRPVLRDVDLDVPAGQVVALVGRTGSGKSTLAKLLNRFYDPDRGAVLVDGTDLRAATLASVRRAVLLVAQEGFLFRGSLADNLRLGAPDASDADLEALCRSLGLDELLARLPDGLRTSLGERGSGLSSGERQLVALARALLAQPRVLVLDEATASLDLRTEALVDRAAAEVLAGRTAVVIAHRLATALAADRVVVLEDGRVVEDGAPHVLLEQDGPFATMHADWRRGSEPAVAH